MSEEQFISKQAAMQLANDLQISVEGYHLYNQAINNYCAEIGSMKEAIVRCNDCYLAMQNCHDKSICCEDETGLCDCFEELSEAFKEKQE